MGGGHCGGYRMLLHDDDDDDDDVIFMKCDDLFYIMYDLLFSFAVLR